MTKKRKKAALVTGGACRIGRAVVLDLARAGYDIALHYHTSKVEALATAREVGRVGVACDLFPADLSEASVAVDLMRGVLRRFPGLEVLVNSASIFSPSDLTSKRLAELQLNWQLHVASPWALGCAFHEQARRGVIINFTDTKVMRQRTEHAAYLLSKKALHSLTTMAAVAFAPDVRVNAVAPGFILSPAGVSWEYIRKRAALAPLGGPGTLTDITRSVRFLIESTYITGQTVYVDGGEHLV